MHTRIALPIAGLVFVGVLAYACTHEPPGSDTPAHMRSDSASGRSPGALTGEVPMAQVRFVNAMPGSPALEILTDSVLLFANMVFGAVSPYKDVANQRVRFSLRTADDRTLRAPYSEIMQARVRYTVVALPDRAGVLTLRVVRDDLVPQLGRARVRVIHAAPDFDSVSVLLTGQRTPLMEELTYGGAPTFRDIAPVTSGFHVRRAERGPPLLAVKQMALSAGRAYTLILTSRSGQALAGITFADAADGVPD